METNVLSMLLLLQKWSLSEAAEFMYLLGFSLCLPKLLVLLVLIEGVELVFVTVIREKVRIISC